MRISLILRHSDFAGMEKVRENALISLFLASFYCGKEAKTLCENKFSSGGMTETAMDVRIILKEAILNNATVITLVHNHPSGNNRPSREDDRITERLKIAAECMRIYMCDHVIVTDTKYYSYNEEGRL